MMKIERLGSFITGSDFQKGVELSHKYKEMNKEFISLHKMARRKKFDKEVSIFSAEPVGDNNISLKVIYKNSIYKIDYNKTTLDHVYLKTR